ncbi:MAG TPA: Gfo/Idh/MocA family oxidoreductase [Candidatus Hydrogenedentes bacterium]|nr:Gfo/Idh/MocA family oxidoreductase [Candidatus Hydrogenedentota bacterium]
MAVKTLWGILGTGNIASKFATALNSMDDAELAGVGSRAQESADAFGDRFGVARRYDSYERLAADPDIDLVYISTPHDCHKENAILCFEAGKGVLCEKPFTINRGEAEEVTAAASKAGVFLMEAMWMRYIPAVQQAMRWIREGAIGDARMVQASFGFRVDEVEGRLFDPAAGGGSLLDVGIYPITLAHLAFGRAPDRIESIPYLGHNGVDEQAAILFGYEGGGVALLGSAVRTKTPLDGTIMGTEGMITLHDTFWNASRVSLTLNDQKPQTVELPLDCNGYEYEAREAQRCFHEGLLESPLMTHATTLEVMKIMDWIRADWGLKYPMEG